MALRSYVTVRPSCHAHHRILTPRFRLTLEPALGRAASWFFSFAFISCFMGGVAWAQNTRLYWGDTHLHTSYSIDAYLWGNINADPDTAYRFAQGLPVLHPTLRNRVRLERPLDFLVVSDHAEMIGVPVGLGRHDPRLMGSEIGREYARRIENGDTEAVGREIMGRQGNPAAREEVNPSEFREVSWAGYVDAAERHYQPGRFTTLVGWEWSSTPGANLHRVIFTPADGATARQFFPFASYDSTRPEDLWRWLEETSARTGADFVAIPHNSNLSKGMMFDLVDSEGRPITAEYARARMRWEPVVEVVQIKGSSETSPELSPDDEFADFEIYRALLTGGISEPGPGDFVRSALLRGIQLEAQTGVNPYKFGLQGATDSHTGLSTADEDNFMGKSVIDTAPEAGAKRMMAAWDATGWDFSAQGLTGVWAIVNTRAAITAAFKRKEVYATSGPRITLRVFGGFSFRQEDAKAKDVAAVGYRRGVPMGGDLTAAPKGQALSLLIHAVKDPIGANLDRVQVVKGWLDKSGRTHERVYEAVWAGSRSLDTSGKLPPVGSTVSEQRARYDNTIGAAQLATVWTDPDFDPQERAFYYLRVIQIPTPRHSLYDALALGLVPVQTKKPTEIQERAFSSPIWYTP